MSELSGTAPGDEAMPGLSEADDHAAARELSAERMAMTTLGADCSSPVDIHAREVDARSSKHP